MFIESTEFQDMTPIICYDLKHFDEVPPKGVFVSIPLL